MDESGIEDNACREYGWNIKGTKMLCREKTYQHNSSITMIAELCNKEIIAPAIFEGNCNKDVFEIYVQDILIKELKLGQVVVMDNINFHKTSTVQAFIKSVSCSILFLPTYSPNLNPIEDYWFNIKNQVRKIAGDFDNFFDAVFYALKIVTTYLT